VIGYVGSSGLSRFPHLRFSCVPPTGCNTDPESIERTMVPETRIFRWWDVDRSTLAGR
jgi:hypothetical protein